MARYEHLPIYKQTYDSYLGMMRHVNAYKARRAICGGVDNLFIRADQEFTKVIVGK